VNRSLSLAAGCLAAAVVWAAPHAAWAQGNYRSTPIGGRSALMGGTGVALGRDGSAPFLNPARIADIADNSLAFSVNFYSYQNAHFTSFSQPGAVDRNTFGQGQLPSTSLDQSRLDALPSTLCLFFTLKDVSQDIDRAIKGNKGRQKLAVCLGNLERQNLDVNSARYAGSTPGIAANQTMSFNHSWNRLYVGPTFGMYVTDALTLGVSLHGVYTTYSSVVSANDFGILPGGGAVTSSYDSSGNGTSFDLGATLGATYHLDSVYTLGLSATTPTIHVAGGYSTALATQFDGVGSFASLSSGTGHFTANAPIRIAAGLGAELPRVKVEADVTYYFPRSNAAETDLTITESTTANGGPAAQRTYAATFTDRAEPVVNSALGIEWLMSRTLSMLAGVDTDFSSAPLIASTSPPAIGQVTTSRLSRAGASFGLGSRAGGSELLFGTELSYGWGRAFVPNEYVLPNRLALTEEGIFTLLLVIGGTTSLDAFKKTAEDLGDLVVHTVSPRHKSP
jgi:hypothetical protein